MNSEERIDREFKSSFYGLVSSAALILLLTAAGFSLLPAVVGGLAGFYISMMWSFHRQPFVFTRERVGAIVFVVVVMTLILIPASILSGFRVGDSIMFWLAIAAVVADLFCRFVRFPKSR